MPLYADVRAPIPRPPLTGLLASASALGVLEGTLNVTERPGDDGFTAPEPYDPTQATGPDSTAPERVGGVQFLPNPCAGGGTFDPCDPEATPLVDPSEFPDYTQSGGIGLKVGIGPCSTLDGYTREESRRIAAEFLNVRQHYLAGREFWRGEQATAAGLPNFFLADASTTSIIGTDLAPCGALGALESAIAGVGSDVEHDLVCSGARGIIHASPAVAVAWTSNYLAYRQGNQLYTTALNTPIITGPGYDGTGPGYDGPDEAQSGYSWAYATGWLQVRLDQPFLPEREMSIDLDTNAYVQWASRGFNVAVDTCCVAAVQIALGDCSPEWGSAP